MLFRSELSTLKNRLLAAKNELASLTGVKRGIALHTPEYILQRTHELNELIEHLTKEINEHTPKKGKAGNPLNQQISVSIGGKPPGDPRCDHDEYENGKTYRSTVTYYVRENEIEYEAWGLAPLTRHHLFINGQLLTGHCRNRCYRYDDYDDFHHRDQTPFKRRYNEEDEGRDFDDMGAEPVTDKHGRIRGQFYLPSSVNFCFKGGTKITLELSNNGNGCGGASSYAKGEFYLTRIPHHEEEEPKCNPKHPECFVEEFIEGLLGLEGLGF